MSSFIVQGMALGSRTESNKERMNIGELARQTGASVRSLRYYETRRLIAPRRRENGYRSYDANTVERVKTIQYYLRLGLTTNEIFDVVFCRNADDLGTLCTEPDPFACSGLKDFYTEKLAEIEAQIASLEKAKAFLTQNLARMSETATA
jgi:MerR family transcriptional regulator, Zn(II)-responsive regulator of zntA